jgi:hypothetical protein
MDLDTGLLEIIDEYISDAIAVTGTRRAPRVSHQRFIAREPEPEAVDLEPQTESLGTAAADDASAGAFVIDEQNADAALLAQVSQQLAQSESALEALPRTRAARGTVGLEDEVTMILARPGYKSL